MKFRPLKVTTRNILNNVKTKVKTFLLANFTLRKQRNDFLWGLPFLPKCTLQKLLHHCSWWELFYMGGNISGLIHTILWILSGFFRYIYYITFLSSPEYIILECSSRKEIRLRTSQTEAEGGINTILQNPSSPPPHRCILKAGEA